MTDRATRMEHLLPEAIPPSPYARLLLYGIRRMAAGGLDDAFAAHAFFAGFGLGYRQPLVLLRAMMAELARVSTIRIPVAPCCCPRATTAEHALLRSIAHAGDAPQEAHAKMCDLLKVRHCLALVTSLQAVGQCFADRGMALDDCMKCNGDELF